MNSTIWIVCVKHALTREVFDFRRESSRRCPPDNRSPGRSACRSRSRRDHDRARCARSQFRLCCRRLLLRFADVEFSFRIGFTAERHVVANHQQRRTIEPGVPAFEPVQLRTRKTREHFRVRPSSTLRRHRFDQFARNDVNLVAAFECRVLKIRMHCDPEIRRQRPWRRGPDQNKNFSTSERRIDQRRIALQRKLHVDRRARVLVIFNFSFSERRLILDDTSKPAAHLCRRNHARRSARTYARFRLRSGSTS